MTYGQARGLDREEIGRLTVLGRTKCAPKGKTYWSCQCECGNTCDIRGDHLKTGAIRSCGCLISETAVTQHTTHGKYHTRLYAIYRTMLARCNNPNHNRFKNYGGRGIKVCEEWASSFETFYEWAVKNGYKEGLTIDRKDTDGPYCPDNCRWATIEVQANNRRNNHRITVAGVTKTIAEWARETGISEYTIAQRINKLGWNPERAVTEGVGGGASEKPDRYD